MFFSVKVDPVYFNLIGIHLLLQSASADCNKRGLNNRALAQHSMLLLFIVKRFINAVLNFSLLIK